MLIGAFLLLCGTLGAGRAYGQRGLPGQVGLQFNLGTVDGFLLRNAKSEYSYFGSLALTRSNRNRTHWLFGASYLQRDYRYGEQIVPKAQFTGEAGYFVPLASDRGRNVGLSLGLSALAGYETSNWGTKLLYDGSTLSDKDAFVWGGALTVEFNAYLTDRVVLLLNVRERALGGSDIGSFHTQLGFGFRFIIN